MSVEAVTGSDLTARELRKKASTAKGIYGVIAGVFGVVMIVLQTFLH